MNSSISDSPFRRLLGAAAVLLTAMLAIMLLYRFITDPRAEGDSGILAQGIVLMDRALQEGRLSCPEAAFSNFALFQHLSGWLIFRLVPEVGPWGWVSISIASFFACGGLLFFWIRRRRSAALAAAAGVVFLSGPLLWYGASTFNEMTAAFVTLLFTAAVLSGASAWWCMPLFVLAGFTKDIATPFLLLIWLAGLVAQSHRGLVRLRRQVAAMMLASAMVLCATAAFNYFRYQSIFNEYNLQEHVIVRSFGQQVEYFLGLWFSPSGGLVVFWPLFAMCLGCAVVGAWRRRTMGWRELTPAALIVAIVLGLTWGLAHWYSPFGWNCWGPRLLLPWIPSLLLMLIYFYPAVIERGLHSALGGRFRFTLTATVVLLLSLPHLFLLYSPGSVPAFFMADPSFLPRTADPSMDTHWMYQTMHRLMWTGDSLLLRVYREAERPAVYGPALLYAATLLAILAWIATTPKAASPATPKPSATKKRATA